MPKGVTFEVQGLQGFRAALERATDDIRARVSQAMEATAYAVQAGARAHLSDDGDLSDAIIVTGRKLSWRVGISDIVIPGRGGDRIHQRPFIYGAIRERGSKKQPARPFIRPAADEEFERFNQRVNLAGLVF